ncbi:hypothetical protein [Paraburkholderia youngii]|uniref:hypothetical protein n=1 Tax=Paraburkholderia youngii TaxID=2782701 RepID=UPI003D20F0B4
MIQSEAMLVEHKLMASRTVAVRGADPIIIEAIPLNTVADCHSRAVSPPPASRRSQTKLE